MMEPLERVGASGERMWWRALVVARPVSSLQLALYLQCIDPCAFAHTITYLDCQNSF